MSEAAVGDPEDTSEALSEWKFEREVQGTPKNCQHDFAIVRWFNSSGTFRISGQGSHDSLEYRKIEGIEIFDDPRHAHAADDLANHTVDVVGIARGSLISQKNIRYRR